MTSFSNHRRIQTDTSISDGILPSLLPQISNCILEEGGKVTRVDTVEHCEEDGRIRRSVVEFVFEVFYRCRTLTSSSAGDHR